MSSPVLALPLRGLVVFPGSIRTVSVGRPSSVVAVERHLDEDRPLLLVPQRDPEDEEPQHASLAEKAPDWLGPR